MGTQNGENSSKEGSFSPSLEERVIQTSFLRRKSLLFPSEEKYPLLQLRSLRRRRKTRKTFASNNHNNSTGRGAFHVHGHVTAGILLFGI
jgi:hypothetical protein